MSQKGYWLASVGIQKEHDYKAVYSKQARAEAEAEKNSSANNVNARIRSSQSQSTCHNMQSHPKPVTERQNQSMQPELRPRVISPMDDNRKGEEKCLDKLVIVFLNENRALAALLHRSDDILGL